MPHPIFSVLLHRPELVFEHMAGYAALLREESSSAGLHVAKRTIAWIVAGASLTVFVMLLGVAIMLGAVQENFHWTLVVVPALPLGVAIAAAIVARQQLPEKAFSELRAQLDADAQALRDIRANS